MTLLTFEPLSRIPEFDPHYRHVLIENRQAELDILYKLTGEFMVNEYIEVQSDEQQIAV
jgi:hypothetical protein